MKWFGYAIAFLLVGIAVGGWSPRVKLRRLEKEVRELRDQIKQRESGRDPVGAAIGDLLRIPEEAENGPITPAAGTNNTEVSPVETVVSNAHVSAVEPTTTNAPRQPRDLEQRIEQAVEAWRLRSELARDQYLSRVQANDEQSIKFQVLMDHMNIRIGETIDVWADAIRQNEVKGEEAIIRMTSEITAAMALTYEQLDTYMPEGWRESDGGSFSLTDFIDPDVASPLIGLDEEIDL